MAKIGELYESTDEHIGQPADDPPKSDWSADFHHNVPQFPIHPPWRPGQQICHQLDLNLDQDPKWQSVTVAITSYGRLL